MTAAQPPAGSWGRRPLSVVILGNSLPLMQVPLRPTHGAGTYPEVLADCIAARGIPVQLASESYWFELAHTGARRVNSVLGRHYPDVLVVNYGVNEMLPWLVPVPVLRHLMRREPQLTRLSRAYRKRLADPAWDAVKRYRRWAAPHVGMRTWQLRPGKFRASIEHIVRQSRRFGRPLVLVVDINPPGEIMQRYLPGARDRYPVFQKILVDVVEQADDPDVRLVAASGVVASLGDRTAMPDSVHWTPDAHAKVGQMLADEVLAWLESGGHK